MKIGFFIILVMERDYEWSEFLLKKVIGNRNRSEFQEDFRLKRKNVQRLGRQIFHESD